MSDKYFLDTNIFVNCFDKRQPKKKERSRGLISAALQTGSGVISTQVIQEFLNVATRQFTVALKAEDCKLYLQEVLHPLCQVFPDLDLYQEAIDLVEETGYSFYDSLILAGALRGGCAVLYSEDFKSGQKVRDLRLLNPFNDRI